MMNTFLIVLLLSFSFFYSTFYSHSLFAYNPQLPKLILANIYHQNITLSEYWVSEKYDGVRAYWNGKELISRDGNIFSAPTWFTENFPNSALDGELWIQRNSFDHLSGIVRNTNPDNPDWKKIHYMVFDAPEIKGSFSKRYQYLQTHFNLWNSPYITLVKQWQTTTDKELQTHLHNIVKNGGEGLMLHKSSSYYTGGRSNDLIKLKLYEDREAIVIKHISGKGKYKNMLGSMEVAMADGKHFRLGSGFTDAERKQPPALGSIITYRFNGTTKNGLPRFARFVRVHEEF